MLEEKAEFGLRGGNPCVGGTFDIFHDGHRELLDRASEAAEGRKLLVGITSDRFASSTRNRDIRTFEERARVVSSFLKGRGCRFEIVELNDPYGPAATDPGITSIIASTDTYGNAVRINELRVERGLGPLEIITVDMVRGEDGIALSSTGIFGAVGKERADSTE